MKRKFWTSFVAVAASVLLIPSRPPVSSQSNNAFVTVGEVYTSEAIWLPMRADVRMFAAPDLEAMCRTSARPYELVPRHTTLTVPAGNWFDLGRLRVMAVNSRNEPLQPVPVTIEIEQSTASLIQLRSDMISGGRLLPIRPGRTKARVRSLCDGSYTEVAIDITDKPVLSGDWSLEAITKEGVLSARLLIEQTDSAVLASLFIDNHVLEGALSNQSSQFDVTLTHTDGRGPGHSERLHLSGTLMSGQLHGRYDNGADRGEWRASPTRF